MFELYLIPILIVVAIGLVAGIILVLAAKYMAVSVDEKFELVRKLLPGVNCGACGYAGCDAYATEIAAGNAAVNLCIPGGEKIMRKISNTMGKNAVTVTPRTAVVACSGGYDEVKEKMEYKSRKRCSAASLFYRGMLACDYGCLGFGDCAKVCSYDAIQIIDGLAVVDKRRCSGCGKCYSVCPQHVIHIIPHDSHTYVACSSTDTGPKTRKSCTVGCLGCGKCVKTCPQQAIVLENYLAKIDLNKCINCGACIEVCPVNVIHDCYQSVGKEQIRQQLQLPRRLKVKG